MAPRDQRPNGGGRPSEPGEVKRLLLSLRPAISELFAAYAVPEEEAAPILRDAVDHSVGHCHRTDQPRRLFLVSLEDRCAAHARERERAQKAEEEEKDDDRAPDA